MDTEEVQNVAPPPKPPSPAPLRWTPLTVLIAVANAAVFLVAEAHGSTTDTETLLRFGASERSQIWEGEVWRLITATFLHIGWIHLLWNTYVLFLLCRGVERLFGSWRFGLAYLLTGIGASAVSVLCHDAVSAGASGAGFGMIGIFFVLMFRRLGGWGPFFADKTVRLNLMLIGAWIVLGFVVRFDNFAHLGGLSFGVLIGILYVRPPKRRTMLAPAVFGLLWAGTVMSATVHWPWQDSQIGAYRAAVAADQEHENGNYAMSIELYNRVESMGGSNRELYFNRGLSRAGIEDWIGAIKDFDEALAIDPSFANAFWGRALARSRIGDVQGAISDFTQTLKIKPGLSGVLGNRAELYLEQGDFERALNDYRKALRIDPARTDLFLGRGRARHGAGKFEDAIADFDEVLRIDPKMAEGYHYRGFARAAFGDFDGAIRDFSRGLDLNPDMDGTWVGLADVRLETGDIDGAIADYGRALKADPESVDAFRGRGYARGQKGEYDGAIKDYDEAIRIDSSDARIIANRGWARLQQGDEKGALTDYEKALNLDPELEDAYYGRGLLRKEARQWAAAIADLQRALESAPEDWEMRGEIEKALEEIKRMRDEP